jgi:hypothetical protein
MGPARAAHRPKGGFQHLFCRAVPGCPPHSPWRFHRRSRAAAAGVCGLLAGGATSAVNTPALLRPGCSYPSCQPPESKICVYSPRRHIAVPPALICGPVPGSSGGDKCFTVEIGGKAEVVSIDRLKPHLGQALIAPVPSLARGRPPKPPSSSSAVPPGGRH